ncbi:Caskin-2 [Armadillidium nasatum]|uniref:Caskin-2 n=1 Tax=Armadillidium nasatum TaxID=96803 RepID=A0A5N5STB0_9CRUS|nr:Caskin-2 [Armadillidium nasatum]
MNIRGTAAPNAKKVLPPVVPDRGSYSSFPSTSTTYSSFRHSCHPLSSGEINEIQQTSLSSTNIRESSSVTSNLPSSPHSPDEDSACDHSMAPLITNRRRPVSKDCCTNIRETNTCPESQVDSNAGENVSSSPQYQNNSKFNFHNMQGTQFSHLMCPKASPGSPHHIQTDPTFSYQAYPLQVSLPEDQGIDVQSPGRSSPGSGSGSSTTGSTTSGNCRNSTTSLDSGRASSSTQTHTHRLSGQSYDSGSILRHSYHSSSSSLGSSEHDGTHHLNVQELLNNGVSDSEVLRIWLTELHFEEYYEKFLSSGYDMPTISRMTPEDLNAIGITKPAHRKRLKSEITKLNISDGLPEFIPSRLDEWLTLLKLEAYIPSLKQQNYNTVEQVTQITWEDLEDVMLAIKRVKDIMAGKKFNSLSPLGIEGKFGIHNVRENSGKEVYGNPVDPRHFQIPNQCHDPIHSISRPADPGGSLYCRPQTVIPEGDVSSYHPSQMHLRYPVPYHPADRIVQSGVNATIHYRPDVVPLKIHGNGSARTSEEPIYGTYLTFFPPQRQAGFNNLPLRPSLPLGSGVHPQRSLDDGDITPTNEMVLRFEGGGTLPRPRAANKYRPVAMVTAKTRVDVHEVPSNISNENISLNSQKSSNSDKVFSASTNNTPQGTPKKIPPPPPKRSNSVSESTQQKTNGFSRRGLSYSFISVRNNLVPDGTTDLPPPPPAPQDKGNHQHLPEDFPPPPPPLTCITMASTASRASSVITSSSNTQDIDTVSSSHSTDLILSDNRPQRNGSNSSFKSTSSNDSGDSIPFANDNAGTIKQRSNVRPSFALIDSRCSPRSSPISSPALRRKEGIVHPTLRHPQPHQGPSTNASTNSMSDCQTNKEISSFRFSNVYKFPFAYSENG